MSASDAETIRTGLEAYNRSDLDGMLEMCDEKVVLIPVRARLEGGAYEGHEGVRKFFSDMDEDWSERRVDIAEIRDLGETVLVLGSFHATGRSGVEIDFPVAWHSEFRDGKLLRMTAYTDQDSALRELGLAGA